MINNKILKFYYHVLKWHERPIIYCNELAVIYGHVIYGFDKNTKRFGKFLVWRSYD